MRVLRSSSNCAPTRRSTTCAPFPPRFQLADNVAANRGVCAGLKPFKAWALDLSYEKYCSVWHSMRQDIELAVNAEISTEGREPFSPE